MFLKYGVNGHSKAAEVCTIMRKMEGISSCNINSRVLNSVKKKNSILKITSIIITTSILCFEGQNMTNTVVLYSLPFLFHAVVLQSFFLSYFQFFCDLKLIRAL